MTDSYSDFEDLDVVLSLKRENEHLSGVLSQLRAEEKRLLLEHSTSKAEYLSSVNEGGSALAAHFSLSRREDREKILVESASRVEYLVGNDMVPSYRVSSDGRILSANSACARLLGYKREQFCDSGSGLTLDQIVPEECVALEQECLNDLKEMIVTRTIVTERIAEGGRKIPVACNFRLTKADGSQWAVFLIDLSQVKVLDDELKQRQALFSTLVVEMPNMVFLVDDIGHTWQVNRRFYELTGLDPAGEDGFLPSSVIDPDDLAKSSERWQIAFRDHQPLVGEVRVRSASGEYFWHFFRAIPLIAPLPGQIDGLLQLAQDICPQTAQLCDINKHRFWIGTAADIDSRKRIMDNVLESAYNFQSLADQIPQIVWTAGPDGRIDFFNNRWFEFSGLNREDRVGLEFALFIHANDRRDYVSTWKNCVKTGDALDIKFRLKKKVTTTIAAFEDNDYERFLARAVAVRNQRGEIEQWVGTWTAI